MRTALRSASLLSLALAALSAHAASFQNGSFEYASIDPGDYTRLYPGSTVLAGWSVDSGDVDYVGTRFQASDGSRCMDLSGDEAGSISQTFDTVAGGAYTVLFDMAGNPMATPR